MVKIIKGTYGRRKGSVIVPVRAGETVELTDEQESRLVKLGVAVYINDSDSAPVQSPGDGSEETDEQEVPALPEYNDKLKLPELKEIAEKYGVDASAMTTKKEVSAAIDAAREELPTVGGAGDVVD